MILKMVRKLVKESYEIYLKETLIEKIIHVIVFIAIIISITSFLCDIFNIFETFSNVVSNHSIYILGIFLIELIIDYARFESDKEFFKKHTIDIVLITLLSLTFFWSYFGASKWGKIVKDAKILKLIHKLLRIRL